MLGRADEAVAQLNAIGADQRTWGAARARRALIEQARGKHDAALLTIGEVLVREPRNVDAMVTKARVLLAAEKVDLAETVLRAASRSIRGTSARAICSGRCWRRAVTWTTPRPRSPKC